MRRIAGRGSLGYNRGSSGFRCERRTNPGLVNGGYCSTGDNTL